MSNYTPPQGKGDAVAARVLNNLKIFTDWLAANSQSGKGMISECGIPGSANPATDPIPGSGTGAKYDRRWNAVAEQWFLAANVANLHVTWWNAAEWRVDLRAYMTDDGNNKPLNYRTTVSEVLERTSNLSTVNYLRGVNLAGGEFSDRGPNGSLDRSHLSQPGAGYYYPLAEDFTILASRGMKLIRIPIRWERVQPTLKGALDTTEMTVLKACIDAAVAAGCVPMIDVHNYARYDTTPTGANTNGVYMLGQNAPSAVGGTMIQAFADLWTRLSTYFNYIDSTKIIYDLMNEPHDLPAGASDWQEASRQAVEAIRIVNQTVRIAIEGYLYASVPGWLSQNGSSAWQTQTIPSGQNNAGQSRNNDPNIIWNGHHYFDIGYNGGFEDSYDTELSSASGEGYTSWATTGYVDPYPFNITSQTGLRTTFATDFTSSGDFSGQYDEITGGSQTTLPFALVGNPGSSMRVVSTTTSNEAGVRKSLTGASNARIIEFDFHLDASSTISTTQNFCIAHFWGNNNSSDLAEIRIIGSGSGYKMQINTTATGYPTVTGSTVLTKGTFHKIHFEVVDTNFSLYLDGSPTPDVVFNTFNAGVTVNNTGLNVGGLALGKFYGIQALTLYYDNLKTGLTAVYDAPPNGGLMETVGGGGGGGGEPEPTLVPVISSTIKFSS